MDHPRHPPASHATKLEKLFPAMVKNGPKTVKNGHGNVKTGPKTVKKAPEKVTKCSFLPRYFPTFGMRSAMNHHKLCLARAQPLANTLKATPQHRNPAFRKYRKHCRLSLRVPHRLRRRYRYEKCDLLLSSVPKLVTFLELVKKGLRAFSAFTEDHT